MRRLVLSRYPLARGVPRRGYLLIRRLVGSDTTLSLEIGPLKAVVVDGKPAPTWAGVYREFRLHRGPGWYFLDVEGYEVVPVDLYGLATLANLEDTSLGDRLAARFGCQWSRSRLICPNRATIMINYVGEEFRVAVDSGEPGVLPVPRVPVAPDLTPLARAVGLEVYAPDNEALRKAAETLASMADEAVELAEEEVPHLLPPPYTRDESVRVVPAEVRVPELVDWRLAAPRTPGLVELAPGRVERDYFEPVEGRLVPLRVRRTGAILGVGSPLLGWASLNPHLLMFFAKPKPWEGYILEVPRDPERAVEELLERLLERWAMGRRQLENVPNVIKVETRDITMFLEPGLPRQGDYKLEVTGAAPYVEVFGGRSIWVKVEGSVEGAREILERLGRLDKRLRELVEA